ncbi:hypothetical protein [Xenorhabdus thuongxuanensis]|uniref:Uncharacterized protein n=1 Tax=Xenorhabdus thuongxuanensis TaxID=1873484 RepID=A0A1Q5U3S9_9GAMM|nr:hypothetical protein [Xenorhabdus thuongxuanensis]OKP07131.1 hypothetical protein Xentx_01735 [Xenorhabdus thuongxuanensis]
MLQGIFTIGIKYDTEALNQLASQLVHIAELMDPIHGRRYDAGMTLSVDIGIAVDRFKIYDSEKKLRATIPDDDHIRQIVREELRQFVVRESERGGLFSAW